ncbi:hypothetical protein ACFVTP_11020 [Streptomyces celluloflavus]
MPARGAPVAVDGPAALADLFTRTVDDHPGPWSEFVGSVKAGGLSA